MSFEKSIEKKHLYRSDENYHYFCKSKTLVINLIVGSRNTVKDKRRESFLPNMDNFLVFFYCFWMGKNFWEFNG